MKKIMTRIFALIMMCVGGIGFSGCLSTFDFKNEFIWEGDFAFHKLSDGNYAVLDLTEEGKQKSVLYVPAYFRDGIVTRTQEVHFGEVTDVGYSLNVGHREKIYFPYSHTTGFHNDRFFCWGNGDQEFFSNNAEYYLDDLMWRVGSRSSNNEMRKYYITTPIFNILFSKLSEYQREHLYTDISIKNEYTVSVMEGDFESQIYAANTSYMFNYEGEPNEGYFFINDFERGGLIENTPYEPRREGYTFAGWYKEPDCVNIWDFTKDTLPAAEYDENENLLFVETKLYAKWE